MDITRPHNTQSQSAECVESSNTVDFTCKQVWVNVIIFNSTFQLGGYGDNCIRISDARQYISDIIPVQCPNSPYTVSVHFRHCVFRNMSLTMHLYFNTELPCSKVTISNSVFIHNEVSGTLSITLKGPHQDLVEVKNTHFTKNHVDCVILAQYGQNGNRYTTNEKTPKIPSIIIDNCTFVNNIIIGSAVIDIEDESDIPDNPINLAFYGNNIFTNNKPEKNEGVDDKNDHNGFHFVLAMNNVLVGVSGMVIIEHNEINIAAMTLSPNSKILLHNNSQLRIVNNGKLQTTTQVLVYYSGYTFGNFLMDCHINDCDQRCLFQFVDDNGMYIAEDDLQYFNTSIILSNGGSREKTSAETRPHYLLYNANLQNCTLTLRERNKSMDEDEKRTFFKLDSWDDTTYPMVHPAYHICTCDPAQPEDRALWDCSNGDITSTLYPGLLMRVGLVALGYFGLVRKAKFNFYSELNKESEWRKEHFIVKADNKGCTGLILLKTDMIMPGMNYTYEAEVIYTLYDTPFDNVKDMLTFIFLKEIIVHISEKCPPGFQSTLSSNGTVCGCNQLYCQIITLNVQSQPEG